MKILVIVESPNKVKKIQEYLNKIKEPDQTFLVQATVGHLLDLNKDKGSLGIDIENQFQPEYKPIKRQARVIADLKKTAKKSDQIWIASDLDQEGEFIGYSICMILGLPVNQTKRLIFNEITQSAIQQAVENPTTLNPNVIDAQKGRRIIDRLIGFQLSQVARKVNGGISLGRVKTVLVRLVADREKAVKKFNSAGFYRMSGEFQLNLEIPVTEDENPETKLTVKKKLAVKNTPTVKKSVTPTQLFKFRATCLEQFPDLTSAQNYLEQLDQNPFQFQRTTDQIQLQKPQLPFKTASLQKDGSRSLNLPPKVVLGMAQKLYEQGLISYPRTDTVLLPLEKHQEIKTWILDNHGSEFYQQNEQTIGASSATTNTNESPNESHSNSHKNPKNKKNVQGAHSAIYPTDLKINMVPEVDPGDILNRVYQMIYKRTIASQMAPAKYRLLKLYFNNEKTINWQSQFKTLIFLGYLVLYQKNTDTLTKDQQTEDAQIEDTTPDASEDTQTDDPSDQQTEDPQSDSQLSNSNLNPVLLDEISKHLNGKNPSMPLDIKYLSIKALEDWTKPPHHYDGAGILEQLEKHGIGRPSTWGQLLEDCLTKGFIVKVPETTLKPISRTQITTVPATSTLPKLEIIKINYQPPSQRNRIRLTELGQMTVDFAETYFEHLFNYEFTGQMETRLNQIEKQTESWHQVVETVYKSYQPTMTALLSQAKKLTQAQNFQAQTKSDDQNNQDETNSDSDAPDDLNHLDDLNNLNIPNNLAKLADLKGEKRSLGMYQEQPVYAYYGRYGPVLQIGNPTQTKKSKASKKNKANTKDQSSAEGAVYYPIKSPHDWKTIELVDLPDIIICPRVLGKIKNTAVVLKQSKFGFYLYHQQKTFPLKAEYFKPPLADLASLAQHLDELDFESIAIDLKDPMEGITKVGPYEIRQGPYGPYFRAGTRNISVPPSYRQSLDQITVEQCHEWINNRDRKK